MIWLAEYVACYKKWRALIWKGQGRLSEREIICPLDYKKQIYWLPSIAVSYWLFSYIQIYEILYIYIHTWSTIGPGCRMQVLLIANIASPCVSLFWLPAVIREPVQWMHILEINILAYVMLVCGWIITNYLFNWRSNIHIVLCRLALYAVCEQSIIWRTCCFQTL